MTRTVLSLFTGVGGFDLGLERAGWKVVAQAESDSKARAVLRRHWPDVTLFDDVREVGAETVDRPELICGGFPCQDISIAGKRAGLEGSRSGLWWEFHRVISELRPQWVLIENVAGLLSSPTKDRGADFEAILRALADLGYVGEWRVLDSRFFGVPQRRRRVFLVGHLGARGGLAVLLEQARRARHLEAVREAGEEAAEGTEARAGRDGAGVLADRGIVTALTTGLSSGGPDAAHAQAGWLVPVPYNDKANTLLARDAKGPPTRIDATEGNLVPVAVSENQRAEVRLTPFVRSLTVGGGKPGQGYPAVLIPYSVSPESGQGAHLRATEIDVAPALTATAEAKGTDRGTRIATYAGVRRLTPRECERLQGFPDDWTLLDDQGRVIADTHRYRFMGNAVTVPVVEWIGRRIRMAAASDRVADRRVS